MIAQCILNLKKLRNLKYLNIQNNLISYLGMIRSASIFLNHSIDVVMTLSGFQGQATGSDLQFPLSFNLSEFYALLPDNSDIFPSNFSSLSGLFVEEFLDRANSFPSEPALLEMNNSTPVSQVDRDNVPRFGYSHFLGSDQLCESQSVSQGKFLAFPTNKAVNTIGVSQKSDSYNYLKKATIIIGMLSVVPILCVGAYHLFKEAFSVPASSRGEEISCGEMMLNGGLSLLKGAGALVLTASIFPALSYGYYKTFSELFNEDDTTRSDDVNSVRFFDNGNMNSESLISIASESRKHKLLSDEEIEMQTFSI